MPIFTEEEKVLFNNAPTNVVNKTVGRGKNARTIQLPAPGSTIKQKADYFQRTTGTEVGLQDYIEENERIIDTSTTDTKQGVGSKLLNAIPNILGNTVLETAKMVPTLLGETFEGIGYVMDKYVRQMSDDELNTHDWHKHTNFVNEFIDKYKQDLNNYFEVKRDNANNTFDLTDVAWWIDGVNGAASSIPYMTIPYIGKGMVKAAGAPVAGIAKLAGKEGSVNSIMSNWYSKVMQGIANKANALPKVAIDGSDVKNFINSGASGITSRIVESGQNAGEVYNEVYENVLDYVNNLNDDELKQIYTRTPELAGKSKEDIARYLAGDASSEAFGNNFLSLALLDAIQASKINSIMNPFNTKSKQAARANRAAITARNENYVPNKITGIGDAIGSVIGKIGKTASVLELSEGVEEALSYVGSEMAKDYAYRKVNDLHRERSLVDFLDDDRMWETFTFGAGGGMLMGLVGKGVQSYQRHKTKQSMRKMGMTDELIEQYFSEKEDVRIREINDRERVLKNLESKLAQVNNNFNPYKYQLDANGNVVKGADGKPLYATVHDHEKAELKKQILKEAAVEMTLNSSRVGNYDLLKEYIKNIDYNEMGNEIAKSDLDFDPKDAVKYAEQTRNAFLEAMQETREIYERSVAQIHDNLGIGNPYLADIHARSLTQRELHRKGILEAMSQAEQEIQTILDNHFADSETSNGYKQQLTNDVYNAKLYNKIAYLNGYIEQLQNELDKLDELTTNNKLSSTDVSHNYNEKRKSEVKAIIKNLQAEVESLQKGVDVQQLTDSYNRISNGNFSELFQRVEQVGYTFANERYQTSTMPVSKEDFQREFDLFTARYNKEIDKKFIKNVDTISEIITKVADKTNRSEEEVLTDILDNGIRKVLEDSAVDEIDIDEIEKQFDKIEYGNEFTSSYSEMLKDKVKESTINRDKKNAANRTGGQHVGTDKLDSIDKSRQANGQSSPPTGSPQQPTVNPTQPTTTSTTTPTPAQPTQVIDPDNPVANNTGEILQQDPNPNVQGEIVPVDDDEAVLKAQREMPAREADDEQVKREVADELDHIATMYLLVQFEKESNAKTYQERIENGESVDTILKQIKDTLIKTYKDYNNGVIPISEDTFNKLLDSILEKKINRLLGKNANDDIKRLLSTIYSKLTENDTNPKTSEISNLSNDDINIIESFIEKFIFDNITDATIKDKLVEKIRKAREAIKHNNSVGSNDNKKRVFRVKVDAVSLLRQLVKDDTVSYNDAIRIFHTLRSYQNQKANNAFEITGLAEFNKFYKNGEVDFFEALNDTHNKRVVDNKNNIHFGKSNISKDSNIPIHQGEELKVSVTQGTLGGKKVYNLNEYNGNAKGNSNTITEQGDTKWKPIKGIPISLSIQNSKNEEIGMLGAIQMSEDNNRMRIANVSQGFRWTITNRTTTNYDRFFHILMDIVTLDANTEIRVSNGTTIKVDENEIYDISEIINSSEEDRAGLIKAFYDNYINNKDQKEKSIIYHLIKNGSTYKALNEKRDGSVNSLDTEFIYINELTNQSSETKQLEVLTKLFEDVGNVVNFVGLGQNGEYVNPGDRTHSYKTWVDKLYYNFEQTKALQDAVVEQINEIKGESNLDKPLPITSSTNSIHIKVKVDTLQQSSDGGPKYENVDGKTLSLNGDALGADKSHDTLIYINKTDTQGTNINGDIKGNHNRQGTALVLARRGETDAEHEWYILDNNQPVGGDVKSAIEVELRDILTELFKDDIDNVDNRITAAFDRLNRIFSNAGNNAGSNVNNIQLFNNVIVSRNDKGKLMFMYKDVNTGEHVLLFSYGADTVNNNTYTTFRYNTQFKPNLTKEELGSIFQTHPKPSDLIKEITDKVLENVRVNITNAYTKVGTGYYGNDSIKFTGDPSSDTSVTFLGKQYKSYLGFLIESGVTFSVKRSNNVESTTLQDMTYGSIRYEKVTHTNDAITNSTGNELNKKLDGKSTVEIYTDEILRLEGLPVEKREILTKTDDSIFPKKVTIYNPNDNEHSNARTAFGYYSNGKIYINGGTSKDLRGQYVRTIFHENVHKHIEEKYANDDDGKKELFRKSLELFQTLKDKIGDNPNYKNAKGVIEAIDERYPYIEGNDKANNLRAEEIIVEVLTNDNLRKAANEIEYSNEEAKLVESKTIFDKFIDLLLEIFNINLNKKSILAKQIEIIQGVINNNNPDNTNTNPDDMFSPTKTAMDDLFGLESNTNTNTKSKTSKSKTSKSKNTKSKTSKSPTVTTNQDNVNVDTTNTSNQTDDTTKDDSIEFVSATETVVNYDLMNEVTDQADSEDFLDDNLDDLSFSLIPTNPLETIDEIRIRNNDEIDARLSFGVHKYRTMQDFVAGKTNEQKASRARALARLGVKFSCQ